MIFILGGYAGQEPLPTICQASLVDIAPTLLDMLGIVHSFEQALARYPEELKGHSLKKSMENVLQGSAHDGNVCPARMTTSGDVPALKVKNNHSNLFEFHDGMKQ
jgi:hypothetical protein